MNTVSQFVDRGLAEFPAHRYDAAVMHAIRDKAEFLGTAFVPCGVDADDRLITAADDGFVAAQDLRTASPERSRRGSWQLNVDSEVIAAQQHPEDYMLDRDTSDWLWVHPQWRYLTAENSEVIG